MNSIARLAAMTSTKKQKTNPTAPSEESELASADVPMPPKLDTDWQTEYLARLRLERARIPKRFLGKSLDNFTTARNAKRKAIVQAATAYVQAFNFKKSPPPGLLLEGVVGCGKTHIAVAILQAVIAKGYSGLYYNMPDLLSDIRATYNESNTLTEDELLETINAPDLLVLDDLGAEKTSEWVNDRLYLIINRRYESCKPILVTTNLAIDELSRKLGDRIVSRLCEISHKLKDEFPDEDYRKKNMR